MFFQHELCTRFELVSCIITSFALICCWGMPRQTSACQSVSQDLSIRSPCAQEAHSLATLGTRLITFVFVASVSFLVFCGVHAVLLAPTSWWQPPLFVRRTLRQVCEDRLHTTTSRTPKPLQNTSRLSIVR